ncbi:MAG: MmgE/PrpD family protein, partial [Firmicutes bacterium]|nr:MmgE/PrpD family protein [Bacillota bacterium]
AAAKLMDLDEDQTVSALGMAGTQSGGLWAFLAEGSTCKKLHPARAAVNGLDAAILAKGGMTGPVHILDAKDGGLLRAVSDSFDMSKLTDGLGESFAILNMDKKPYPCCRTTHHAIDSALALRKQGIKPDDIEKAVVRTYDIGLLQCGSGPYPSTPVEAKFSIQYTSAAAFVKGAVGNAEFDMKVIADPEIRRIAENTEVIADPMFTERYPKRWGSRTELTLKDGSTVSFQTDDMSGSIAKPLSPEQEQDKFMSLGSEAFGRERLEKLCSDILRIEELEKLPDLA